MTKYGQWKGFATAVAVLHMAGIGLFMTGALHHPSIIGLAFLAYTFGLRHAFDVDHIAAIDNTVRKMIQQRKSPMGVGFFFSMGHSTVVACMTVVTVAAAYFVQTKLPQLTSIGGLLGTLVSGTFLLIIGFINFGMMMDLFRIFMKMKRKSIIEKDIEEILGSRGFLARWLHPLFRLVTKSWHVYPIGFLFGLGFDTASEIALLATSAVATKQGIPLASIISLPVLFAAGMSLMDTLDGVFMTRAYGWALSTPLRKVYYNLSVTGIGVLAALVIGVIELAQVLTPKLGFKAKFFDWLQTIDFGQFGYILVGLFVVVWGVSYILWKALSIEKRWGDPSPHHIEKQLPRRPSM